MYAHEMGKIDERIIKKKKMKNANTHDIYNFPCPIIVYVVLCGSLEAFRFCEIFSNFECRLCVL